MQSSSSWCNVRSLALALGCLILASDGPRAAHGAAGTTSSAEAAGIGAGADAPGHSVLTGSATPGDVDIDIAAPAGRGLAPATVRLTLGDQGAAYPIVGRGWSLQLGAIIRMGKLRDRPPAYDASDEYAVASPAGAERLVFVAADGWFHTERETWSRFEYVAAGDYWVHRAPDGTRSFFGAGFASGSDTKTTAGGRVWRWHLDRVVDKHGNYMTVSYTKDGNQVYPSAIRYTGFTASPSDPSTMQPGSIASAREVLFDYGVYPGGSGVRAVVAGFPVVTRNLLSSITVKTNGLQVRRYQFSYQTLPHTNMPRLSQYQVFGSDPACTDPADRSCALPPTTFTYASEPAAVWDWTSQFQTQPVQEVIYGEPCSEGDPLRIHTNGIQFLDLDADGFSDYLWNRGGFQASSGAFRNRGVDASGNHLGYEPVPGFASGLPTMLFGSFNFEDGRTDTLVTDEGVQFADVNGDGYPDLIHSVVHDGSSSSACLGPQTTRFGVSQVVLNRLGTSGCDPYSTSWSDSCWQGSGYATLPAEMMTCSTSTVTCDQECVNQGCDITDPNCVPCPGDGCGLCEVVTTETYPCIDPFAAGTCILSYQANGSNYDMGCRVVDLNGDGLPDLQKGLQLGSGEIQLKAWLNSGDPASLWIPADAQYAPPKPFVRWVQEYENGRKFVSMDLGWRMADVNADGLIDLLRAYQDNTNGSQAAVDAECKTGSPAGSCVGVLLNNGDTAGWDAHYIGQGSALYQAYTPRGAVGDAGFATSGSRPLRTLPTGWTFYDANGDGSVDLVNGLVTTSCGGAQAVSTVSAHINNLEAPGWASASQYAPPIRLAHGFGGFVIGDEGISFADVNGDGATDIVQSNTSDSNTRHSDTAGQSGTTRRNTWLGRTVSPFTLVETRDPMGGRTRYSYTPSSRFPQRLLPQVTGLVTRIESIPGTSDPAVATDISYEGGFTLMLPDRVEFRGFRKVTRTDSAGQKRVEYRHTAVPGDPATGSEEHRGLLAREEIWWRPVGAPADVLFSDTTHVYAADVDGARPWNTPQIEETDRLCDQSSTCNWTRRRLESWDSFGNPLKLRTLADDRDVITTFQTWHNDEARWILHQSLTLRTYQGEKASDDAGDGLFSEQVLVRDALGRLLSSTERLSGVDDCATSPTAATCATTTFEYDAFGNQVAITDPLGARTRVDFGLTPCLASTVPERTVNALGHEVSTGYDCRGRAISRTDPNGAVTAYGFDSFGRPTATALPGDTLASPTVTVQYLDPGVPGVQRIRTTTRDGSADGLWKEEVKDGLDRVVETRTEANDGIVHVRMRFDGTGRLISHSVPAFGATSTLETTYEHDGVGRQTRVSHPGVPPVRTAYDRRVTTVTDGRGFRTRTTEDSRGNPVVVEEEHATNQFWETLMRYDPAGRLVEIVDALAQTRSFQCPTVLPNHTCIAFDLAGRRTSIDDPDLGHWSYVHDRNGNVIAQTDARGQTMSMTYDALDRSIVTDVWPAGDGEEDLVTYHDGELPSTCHSCNDWCDTTADSCDASTLTCLHIGQPCEPSCIPRTCESPGVTCGEEIPDGCGGTISCCAGSGCAPVACSSCQTPNACGDACTNLPDGAEGSCGACRDCDGNGRCEPVASGASDVGCNAAATACSGADTCNGAGLCNANHLAAGVEGGCGTCEDCDGSGSCAPVGAGAQDVGCTAAATACSGADTCNGAGVCSPNHLADGAEGSCGTCQDCDGQGSCENVGGGVQDVGCEAGATACSGADTCSGSGACLPNHLPADTEGGCPTCQDCDGDGDCKFVDIGEPDTGCSGGATACSAADVCSGSGTCNLGDLPLFNCYFDGDGDGYGAGAPVVTCSCPAGYVQNNGDCLDTSASVRPGQTACFTSPRPDGSFDYDCSGAPTPCNVFSYITSCQGVYCANPSCPSMSSPVTASNCGSSVPTSCRPNNPFCFQSCSSNDYQTVSCR